MPTLEKGSKKVTAKNGKKSTQPIKKSAPKKKSTKPSGSGSTSKAAPDRYELMFQEGRKIFIVVVNADDNAEIRRRLDKALFLGTVRSYRRLGKRDAVPPGYELEPRNPSDILGDAKA